MGICLEGKQETYFEWPVPWLLTKAVQCCTESLFGQFGTKAASVAYIRGSYICGRATVFEIGWKRYI